MIKIINNKKITGKIIFINYILIKNDEIKFMSFIGLCIKNTKNSVIVKNIIKKEKIYLTFKTTSPSLAKIIILKKYKKKYRLSKLYYK